MLWGFPPSDAGHRKEVGRGVLRWFLVGFLFVVVAAAFAAVDVVAAVAVLALLLLEEVRFVRTGGFCIRFEFLRKG